MKEFIPAAISVSALAFGLVGATPVFADGNCAPVQGTILNNVTSSSTTLGVANIIFLPNKGKPAALTCALQGTATNPTLPFKPGYAQLAFIHEISCNDQLTEGTTGQPEHSFVVLFTQGYLDLTTYTFEEISQPVTGSFNKGKFDGVTGGQIGVTGAVFPATGAINMTFQGDVCY